MNLKVSNKMKIRTEKEKVKRERERGRITAALEMKQGAEN